MTERAARLSARPELRQWLSNVIFAFVNDEPTEPTEAELTGELDALEALLAADREQRDREHEDELAEVGEKLRAECANSALHREAYAASSSRVTAVEAERDALAERAASIVEDDYLAGSHLFPAEMRELAGRIRALAYQSGEAASAMKANLDKFTEASREAVCVGCLGPCRRLFRKTRDGRPWPVDRSICDWCIESMQRAGAELRRPSPPGTPGGEDTKGG